MTASTKTAPQAQPTKSSSQTTNHKHQHAHNQDCACAKHAPEHKHSKHQHGKAHSQAHGEQEHKNHLQAKRDPKVWQVAPHPAQAGKLNRAYLKSLPLERLLDVVEAELNASLHQAHTLLTQTQQLGQALKDTLQNLRNQLTADEREQGSAQQVAAETSAADVTDAPNDPDKAAQYGHIKSFALRQSRLTNAQERAFAHYEKYTIPFTYQREVLAKYAQQNEADTTDKDEDTGDSQALQSGSASAEVLQNTGLSPTVTGRILNQLELSAAFGNDQPVILEIGFGMGVSLVQMAVDNPGKNYLGIEVHSPGVGNCLKLATEQGVTNLRVIRHDAIEVLKALPENSLAGLQLYFPDPWHKARHHKRRIVNPAFLALVKRALKPGGFIHFATDWENYAEHMLEVLRNTDGIHNTSATNDYIPRPDGRPLTKFEARGERLGHGVWDLYFVKD